MNTSITGKQEQRNNTRIKSSRKKKYHTATTHIIKERLPKNYEISHLITYKISQKSHRPDGNTCFHKNRTIKQQPRISSYKVDP